jgi:hypothetical protein
MEENTLLHLKNLLWNTWLNDMVSSVPQLTDTNMVVDAIYSALSYLLQFK